MVWWKQWRRPLDAPERHKRYIWSHIDILTNSWYLSRLFFFCSCGSSSSPHSEKRLAQGFSLCWSFPLSSCHSGTGSLPEFKGQASGTSQYTDQLWRCTGRRIPSASRASASASRPKETHHSHSQRYPELFSSLAWNLAAKNFTVALPELKIIIFCVYIFSTIQISAKDGGGWMFSITHLILSAVNFNFHVSLTLISSPMLLQLVYADISQDALRQQGAMREPVQSTVYSSVRFSWPNNNSNKKRFSVKN